MTTSSERAATAPETTLTDFLLARIAEDEATANESEPWEWAESNMTRTRFLAECEAKRRIVEEHGRRRMRVSRYNEPAAYENGGCAVCAVKDDSVYGDGWGDEEWPCPTLRALALPYADHPDYRDEWRG